MRALPQRMRALAAAVEGSDTDRLDVPRVPAHGAGAGCPVLWHTQHLNNSGARTTMPPTVVPAHKVIRTLDGHAHRQPPAHDTTVARRCVTNAHYAERRRDKRRVEAAHATRMLAPAPAAAHSDSTNAHGLGNAVQLLILGKMLAQAPPGDLAACCYNACTALVE
jgi:hypothetical protein